MSMRRLFTKILLLMFAFSVQASPALDELLKQASEAGLHDRSQWLALLHYREQALSSDFASQADDRAFFLADNGHHDAAAELQANLRRMLKPAAPGHAQCLFPARWAWLKQQLGISDEYDVACPRLQRWLASMSRDGLSLVFPAMYLNNPGSSFGHTFLRFDNQSSALLSHALNYAALYDPSDDLLTYSLKGIFGGYIGAFNLKRYFATVQEYSNIENRDIWEYQLDYRPDEIEFLLLHVWEVLQVDFSYYFFSENCSYRLLALLDVMREGSQLASREHFPWYAIPVDTVRVIEAASLVTQREFRPSLLTKIDSDIAAMDEASLQSALQLADANFAQQPAETASASALELAVDIRDFRGLVNSSASRKLLLARSKLGTTARQAVAMPAPPESGHSSARLELAAGREQRLNVAYLGIRPAFHDLLDLRDGFIEGAAIDIMSLRFAARRGDAARLDELVFVNMESLPAWRSWYRPLSWLLDLRLQQYDSIELNTQDDFTGLKFSAGLGASFSLLDSWIMHALLLSDTRLDNELQKDFSSRLGIKLGLSAQLPAKARLLLSVHSLRDIAGQDSRLDSLSLGLQYPVSKDLALRLSASHEDYGQAEADRWALSLFHYF